MNDSRVTITLRRSHLYLIIGLLVGIATGAVVTKVFFAGHTTYQLAGPNPTGAVSAAGGSTPATSATVKVDTRGAPYRGPADAKVTVVEFTDYQCPFCGQNFRQNLPTIKKRYASKIKYVIRNFPLTNLHPFAERAAEAADCAAAGGRFWPYHDMLFTHQAALGVPALKQYAAKVGLAQQAFDTCLDSHRERASVRHDIADGTKYGVTGTPTFFVNGQMLVGVQPLAGLESVIDSKLRAG